MVQKCIVSKKNARRLTRMLFFISLDGLSSFVCSFGDITWPKHRNKLKEFIDGRLATVEPPHNGQADAGPFVRYLEVFFIGRFHHSMGGAYR